MDDHLAPWVQSMTADGYSPRTVEARVTAVTVFSRAAHVLPDDLERAHVLEYLATRELKPRTRRAYLSHLRAWSTWRHGEDLTDGIRRPPMPRGIPRPVSEAHLRRLLLAARPGHRETAYLLLGAFAGTRAHETAKVCAEDLELHVNGWQLRVVGKGGVERTVPVADVLLDVLTPLVDAAGGRGRLWPDATSDSVRMDLQRLGATADVRFSSHQLRHRFGTQVFRATRDLLLVQQLMGHASPSTTAIYVEVAADEGAAAIALLPGAGRVAGGMG